MRDTFYSKKEVNSRFYVSGPHASWMFHSLSQRKGEGTVCFTELQHWVDCRAINFCCFLWLQWPFIMEHRLDIRSDMRLFPWTFWLFPSFPHSILQVTRTWRPTKKRNSLNSQFLPSYPSWQVQLYSPRPSLHLPWFRQGLLSHWSPSAKKGFGNWSLRAISITMGMTLLCWSWHTFFR